MGVVPSVNIRVLMQCGSSKSIKNVQILHFSRIMTKVVFLHFILNLLKKCALKLLFLH